MNPKTKKKKALNKTDVIQSLLFRIILFIPIFSALIAINMVVFRSELPMLWLISLPITLGILIYFPYKKFFNI